MSAETKPQLFNSPLEAGVRSVVLLTAATPKSYDLTHLTWLDHLVVHTADISGPESLHPDIPQRAGELVVRRQIVEEGLRLMSRLHMVEAQYTSNGIYYAAREEAFPFVQLVRTPYGKALKDRADWLIKYINTSDPTFLAKLIQEKVGRWTIEFQFEGVA